MHGRGSQRNPERDARNNEDQLDRRAQPIQTQINTDTQGDTGGPADETLQGSDEGACANLQIYGIMAHKKDIAQLDQISLEAKWGSGAPFGLERFLHNSLHKPGGQR